MKVGQLAMVMHVDYINHYDSEVIIRLGKEVQHELYQIVELNTSRQKILTFIDNQYFEFVKGQTISALCEYIGYSTTRIGAIIISDSDTSPFFYKKMREIASAEGALLILHVSHSSNTKQVIRYASPDCLLFFNEECYWLGCSKNTVRLCGAE